MHPIRAAAALLLLLLLAPEAQAQAYEGSGPMLGAENLTGLLVGLVAVLLLVIVLQVAAISGTIQALAGLASGKKPAEAIEAEQGASTWQRIQAMLTRRPSLEKEQQLILRHEYDGIQELDNVLPPWWLWLFYGTIIWSAIYLVNMHVTHTMPHSLDEYEAEMAQAKAEVEAYVAKTSGPLDENNVTVTTDANALAGAKANFAQFCSPCHGPDAAGSATSVGPNLTDAYWLHGGGVKNIFHTITYGVPEKGMISWKSQLKPQEIQALASYILSLQGTGPSTQKPPQGELWKGDQAEGGAGKEAAAS